MKWPLLLSCIALGLHVLALTIWLKRVIREHVEKWVWYAVVSGIAAMMTHRLADIIEDTGTVLASFTGLLIAGVVLVSLSRTFTCIRRKTELESNMAKLTEKLTTLQEELTTRGHVAEQLAEVLSDLRGQIDYYESQAKTHKLPLYPE